LTSRILILIIAFLSVVQPVFAQTQKTIRLSPILQIWNTETQKLELLFNIVNETDHPVAFSTIVHFNSRLGKGWKEQPTTKLQGNRAQLIRLAFKPEVIRIGDFISTSVVLYGPGFKGFYDLEEQYFEITNVTKLSDGKLLPDFVETPTGRQRVWTPIDIMNGVAEKLAKPEGMLPTGTQPNITPKEAPPVDGGKATLQVLMTLPGDLASETKPEASITAIFNEPLNRGSINRDTVLLVVASGGMKNRKIDRRVSIKGSQITITPVKKLQPNTTYQVVLSNRIQSQVGSRMKKTMAWHFSTQKKVSRAKLFGPEKLYLKVMTVSPRVKELDVLTDTIIRLKLSGSLNLETVNTDTFFLTDKSGKINSTVTASKDQITLKPKEALQLDTIYTAVATPMIKDSTGKSLKKPVRWQFKTRAGFPYPEADDPNILIFSPSHEPVAYVKEKTGVLKIGITAFSKILHADVNGRRLTIKGDTKIELDIPYQLKSRSTPFEITTFTEEGKARKKIVINFGNKPKPRKPPFQLITILSAAQTDNLNNEPDDVEEKVTAGKMTITVVPQYEIKIWEPSVLRFKGILLRERYAKEEHEDRETSYTQVAIEWEERKTFIGTFIAAIGWNFVRLNNSNFIGENEISEETFFSGKIKQKSSKTDSRQFTLEYKNKNATVDALDVDNETDGSEISLGGSSSFATGSLKHKTKYSLAVNDAIGKYQDYVTGSLGYSISAPLGNVTPSLGCAVKHKQMSIFNPSEGVTPEYTSGSVSARIKVKLFPKTYITAEAKSKNQTSNLENSSYTTNTGTLSIIQIF